jgi:RsiW-degrading membrane proteinase PrsW (M82 family)
MTNASQNNWRDDVSLIHHSVNKVNPIQKYAQIPKEKLYLMLLKYGNELEESIPLLEERINFIILFQRIDHEEIEKVLNRLLDCVTWDMGFDAFERLIGYYHKINPMGAINFQSQFNKIIRLQSL